MAVYICFSMTLLYMCYATRIAAPSFFHPIEMILVPEFRLKKLLRNASRERKSFLGLELASKQIKKTGNAERDLQMLPGHAGVVFRFAFEIWTNMNVINCLRSDSVFFWWWFIYIIILNNSNRRAVHARENLKIDELNWNWLIK